MKTLLAGGAIALLSFAANADEVFNFHLTQTSSTCTFSPYFPGAGSNLCEFAEYIPKSGSGAFAVKGEAPPDGRTDYISKDDSKYVMTLRYDQIDAKTSNPYSAPTADYGARADFFHNTLVGVDFREVLNVDGGYFVEDIGSTGPSNYYYYEVEFDDQGSSIFHALGTVTFDAPIVTLAVPEPETYTLLLGGLGVVGAAARGRRPRQGIGLLRIASEYLVRRGATG